MGEASMQVMQQWMASQRLIDASMHNPYNSMLGAAARFPLPNTCISMLGANPESNAMKMSATAPSMFPFVPPVSPLSSASLSNPFAPSTTGISPQGFPPVAAAPTAAPNQSCDQGVGPMDTNALKT